MTIPRFTAEAATGRPTRRYPSQWRASAAIGLTPAQRLESDCGPCNCEPGRCCRLTLFGCECYTCGAPETQTTRPVFRLA